MASSTVSPVPYTAAPNKNRRDPQRITYIGITATKTSTISLESHWEESLNPVQVLNPELISSLIGTCIGYATAAYFFDMLIGFCGFGLALFGYSLFKTLFLRAKTE